MIALLMYTVLSMVAILVALLVRWNSGEEEHNAGLFVAVLAICNLYVIGLAFFVHPVVVREVNTRGLATDSATGRATGTRPFTLSYERKV